MPSIHSILEGLQSPLGMEVCKWSQVHPERWYYEPVQNGSSEGRGSRQIYPDVFISQTFQGFASLLCSSGRSSGKQDQAVLHMF